MNIRSLVTVVLFCTLAGCVPSKNGLIGKNEEGSVRKQEFLGDWQLISSDEYDEKEECFTRISRPDPKSNRYVVTRVDPRVELGKNRPTEPETPPLEGYLIEIDGQLYFDVEVKHKILNEPSFHVFVGVQFVGDRLYRLFMDPVYLGKHPDWIPHKSEKMLWGGKLDMITGTTDELREFFKKHGRDKELWDKESARSWMIRRH